MADDVCSTAWQCLTAPHSSCNAICIHQKEQSLLLLYCRDEVITWTFCQSPPWPVTNSFRLSWPCMCLHSRPIGHKSSSSTPWPLLFPLHRLCLSWIDLTFLFEQLTPAITSHSMFIDPLRKPSPVGKILGIMNINLEHEESCDLPSAGGSVNSIYFLLIMRALIRCIDRLKVTTGAKLKRLINMIEFWHMPICNDAGKADCVKV